MKGRKTLFLLWGAFTFSIIYVLPVVIITDKSAVLNLSWYEVSKIKTLIISMMFLCTLVLVYFKRYKFSVLVEIITVAFYAFMLFSSKISVIEYQNGQIEYNYLVAFITLGNIFVFLVHSVSNIQINIKLKELEFSLIKPITVSAFILLCVFSLSIYDKNINTPVMAAESSAENATNCAGMVILPVDRNFETEPYNIGEVVNIEYTLPEDFNYLEFDILTEGTVGITISSDFIKEGDSITGFLISFSVEQEGEGNIDIVLSTNENEFISHLDIFVYAENDNFFVDDSAIMYCKEKYYKWQLGNSEIDLEGYNEKIDDMFRITEENAIIESNISEISTYASDTVTVTGTIKWTDTEGKTHAADGLMVEIMDEDLVGDDVITTVYTDSNGKYTATFANDTSIL